MFQQLVGRFDPTSTLGKSMSESNIHSPSYRIIIGVVANGQISLISHISATKTLDNSVGCSTSCINFLATWYDAQLLSITEEGNLLEVWCSWYSHRSCDNPYRLSGFHSP